MMVKTHSRLSDNIAQAEAVLDRIPAHVGMSGVIIIILVFMAGRMWKSPDVSTVQSSSITPILAALQSECYEAFVGCIESSTHSTLCKSALEELNLDGDEVTKLHRVKTKLQEYQYISHYGSSNNETVVGRTQEASNIGAAQSDNVEVTNIVTAQSDNAEVAEPTITILQKYLTNITESLDNRFELLLAKHVDLSSQVQDLTKELERESKTKAATPLHTWNLTKDEEGRRICEIPIPYQVQGDGLMYLQRFWNGFCATMPDWAFAQPVASNNTLGQRMATSQTGPATPCGKCTACAYGQAPTETRSWTQDLCESFWFICGLTFWVLVMFGSVFLVMVVVVAMFDARFASPATKSGGVKDKA